VGGRASSLRHVRLYLGQKDLAHLVVHGSGVLPRRRRSYGRLSQGRLVSLSRYPLPSDKISYTVLRHLFSEPFNWKQTHTHKHTHVPRGAPSSGSG
jgi:hypothetical protein